MSIDVNKQNDKVTSVYKVGYFRALVILNQTEPIQICDQCCWLLHATENTPTARIHSSWFVWRKEKILK